MGHPTSFLREELFDESLKVTVPPDGSRYVAPFQDGERVGVEILIAIDGDHVRARFFPDMQHAFEVDNEVHFEGAWAVFIDLSGRELSPHYSARLRVIFDADDKPSGEIRLWEPLMIN